jgi:hypothetical protein
MATIKELIALACCDNLTGKGISHICQMITQLLLIYDIHTQNTP